MKKLIVLYVLLVFGTQIYARSPRNTLEYLYYNDIKKFEKRSANEGTLEAREYQAILVEYLLFDPYKGLDTKRRKKAGKKIFKSLSTVKYLESLGAKIKNITPETMLDIAPDLMTDALFEYILDNATFADDAALWVDWFTQSNRITSEIQHSLDLIVARGFDPNRLLNVSGMSQGKRILMEALVDDPYVVDTSWLEKQNHEVKRAILLTYAQNLGINMLEHHLMADKAVLTSIAYVREYTTGGQWVTTGPNGAGYVSPVVRHTQNVTFREELSTLRLKAVNEVLERVAKAIKVERMNQKGKGVGGLIGA
jgi:hypothetical protein